MNIEYFYSFIEAVNQKSLSKASEHLNISQPALSKQIRKLEEYFDAVLLKRTTSGVELTEAGELIYKRLPNILGEIAALGQDVHQLRQERTYSIGTLPSLAGNYIPSKILKLKEKGFRTEVVVKNTSQEIYELLQKGDLDAAIIEDMSFTSTFWKRELFEEPLYAIVHISHRLSKKKAVTIDDIAEEEFVLYPSNCTIRKTISHLVKELKVKTEVEFGEFLIGYVAAGGGITVVPEITATFTGHTLVKAIPILDINRHISLISHTRETGKWLFSFLKEK